MKKNAALLIIIFICLAALVYISLLQGEPPPPPLPTGNGLPPGHPAAGLLVKAPDFTLTDLDGNRVSLSDFQGKAVIINFWSWYCRPCVIEMPSLENLKKRMDGKPFEILTITSDSKRTAIRAVEKLKLELPVLLDTEGRAARKFGVYNTPTTFIIAPDGEVDNYIIGPANWADGSVVDYLDKLIAQSRQGQKG